MSSKICENTRALLSRFLDADLDGAEAAQIAGHVGFCLACRHEYARLSEMRDALRALPMPPQSLERRDRVFARLERAAASSPAAPNLTFRLRPAVRRPLAAALAAGCAFAAAFFWMPRVSDEAVLPSPPAALVALPDGSEMATLFHLHDAQGASLSAEEPIARDDRAAEAHAALLRESDAALAGSL